MNNKMWIAILFYLIAAYDGILGLIFLIFPTFMFDLFSVTLPNHLGYVQFPALILIIFAFMFFAVARKPIRNYNLIPYGIMLKIAYAVTVFGYWFTSGIPTMWKPFAIIDFITAFLFYWAYSSLKNDPTELNKAG